MGKTIHSDTFYPFSRGYGFNREAGGRPGFAKGGALTPALKTTTPDISEYLGSCSLLIENPYIMITASDCLIPQTASRGENTHAQTYPVSWL